MLDPKCEHFLIENCFQLSKYVFNSYMFTFTAENLIEIELTGIKRSWCKKDRFVKLQLALYHLSSFVYHLDLAHLYHDCNLWPELFKHFFLFMASQIPMDAHDGQDKWHLQGKKMLSKPKRLGRSLTVWHSWYVFSLCWFWRLIAG